MATTTTNYGFDIPQSTDLVKDGATAIATLGQDIDTAMNTALGTKKAGMVLLNTTSFSGVSSVSLPAGTFTSTYRNYKLIVNCTATVGAYLQARLRASGTDNSATAYTSGSNYVQYNPSGSPTSDNQAGVGTSWRTLGYLNTTGDNSIEIELMQPQVTGKTGYFGWSNRVDDSLFMMVGGTHSGSNSFDSLTLIPVSGNITGSVNVYGYNI